MPTFDSNSDNPQIKKTFELLNYNQERIVLDERYKKVILVLGNSGEGKSTFVQWLATDGETLISKETEKGTGTFIITDDNHTGNSTIDSKTLVPHLVKNPEDDSVFYDCPGFDDTRSTSHDVTSTYLIKKVVDHADSLKMIFVVSYSSITDGTDGENRENFMRLIKHLFDLVKDIDYFRDSISVMVTKVENIPNQNNELVSDEKVIENIVGFFNKVKQALKERMNNGSPNNEDRKLFPYGITFIEIITQSIDDSYPKIGILRKPKEAGHINKAPLLNEEKRVAQSIVNKNLRFVINTHKFGYTISEKSKNDLNDLMDEAKRRIWKNNNDVAHRVKQHYNNLIEPMSEKVRSFAFETGNVEINLDEARKFNISMVKCVEAMSKLKNIPEEINLKELAHRINGSLENSGIQIYNYTNQISNEASYLEFFEIISNNKVSTRPWGSPLRNTADDIEESTQKLRKDIAKTAEKLFDDLATDINAIAKEIINHGQNKTKTDECLQGINELKATLSNQFDTTTQKPGKKEQADDFVDKIKNLVVRLKINTTDAQAKISHATNLEKRLKYLDCIADHPINLPKKIFIDPLSDAARHLDERRKWNEFLSSLSAKLSEEQFQKNVSLYNVANIEDWGYPDKPQGIIITANNIDSFLEKIKQYNIKEYDAIKSAEINESQFRELNEILNSTLIYSRKPEPPQKDGHPDYLPNLFTENLGCTANGEITITVNNIKFSDFFIRDWCQNGMKVKSIKIFALNQVTIDTDISAIGAKLQMIIIAPKWVVDGRRKIILDGARATTFFPQVKYHIFKLNQYTNTFDGLDGQPGSPGGAAGNFFGIGREFINGAYLTITANGGDGGAGQDGGDGGAGYNGNRADVKTELPILSEQKFLNEQNFLNTVEIYKYELLSGYPLALARNSNSVNAIPRFMWVYGTLGQNGGNGGNGGKGGKGGYEGKITIETGSYEYSDIHTFAIKGAAGQGGKGGRGGLGGQYGDKTKVEYWTGYKIIVLATQPDYRRSYNGVAGVNNFNEIGINDPELPPPPIIRTEVVTEYKNCMQAALNDRSGRYNKASIQAFYNQLVGNHQSRQKRSAMKQLENHHHLHFGPPGTNNQIPLLIQNRGSHRENEPNTNTSFSHLMGTVDVKGNLTLAQLISAKINGTNKILPVDTFVSPEEERYAYINELTQHVTRGLRLHEDRLRQDQDDAKGNSDGGWFDYFWRKVTRVYNNSVVHL